MAMSVIEGMKADQSLGALLGFQFERGLHDRHDVEVDEFIYDLRLKFPLAGNRLTPTRTGPTDEAGDPVGISQVEARNVIDGQALVDHLQTHSQTYPFGLTGLPAAEPRPGRRDQRRGGAPARHRRRRRRPRDGRERAPGGDGQLRARRGVPRHLLQGQVPGHPRRGPDAALGRHARPTGRRCTSRSGSPRSIPRGSRRAPGPSRRSTPGSPTCCPTRPGWPAGDGDRPDRRTRRRPRRSPRPTWASPPLDLLYLLDPDENQASGRPGRPGRGPRVATHSPRPDAIADDRLSRSGSPRSPATSRSSSSPRWSGRCATSSSARGRCGPPTCRWPTSRRRRRTSTSPSTSSGSPAARTT